jgi:hypothetical protein
VTSVGECAPNYFCDMQTHKCLPLRDGGGPPPGSGGGGGTGGTEPTPTGGTTGTAGSDGDGGPDPGVTDAPLAPDRTPDADNSCSVDSECGPNGHCLDMRCVACVEDLHCPMERKKCSPARTCVECLANPDCNATSPARPFCTSANVCVECMGHADCKTAERPLCAAGACVRCDAGGRNDGCAAKNNALPVCLESAGTCVQCGVSTDCKADANPICIQNKCAPCTSDSECKAKDGDQPGICLAPREGRCAKNGETIYVQNANPCSPAGGEGTRAMPLCQPDGAVRAVSADRRIIRVRGPIPLAALDIQASGGLITIIGQEGAVIERAPDIGIHIRSGDIYIRSLDVVGSAATGVVVESGANVRLNRVVVKQNLGGGLQVLNGAGFDISNSVFASNVQGGVGPGRFGGVSLGVPGGNRPRVFRANTVAFNEDIGVLCAAGSGQTLVGVLLTGNLAGDAFNCTVPSSSKITTDPRFLSGRPFHIDQGSPCENAAMSNEMPIDDIDGEPRPFPSTGRSDCGADEFHPPQP